MQRYNILWVDDEIDLLKPHILFLEKKGYDITPINNGGDALEICEEQKFDLIFLDENMPGMTGLEVLAKIKTTTASTTPVVMITKSEEEHIMEEAIGAKIADYLIKPLNPNQILLSVKKILDKKRLVTERTNSSYQQEFAKISMSFHNDMTWEEWDELYKKLVYWELEIESTENKSMAEVLEMQKTEANHNFAKFIKDNYQYWMENPDEAPLMSHEIMNQEVFSELEEDDKSPLFFILIDNLRFDQWKILEPHITDYFMVEEEFNYCSILPTTTAFARNAIFAGLTPLEICKQYPKYWTHDNEEGSKNDHESALLKEQLKREGMNMKYSYSKIIHTYQGKQLMDNVSNLMKNPFNVVVYNFVDMLSHARTDTQMIRELAPDESAYRSITESWFKHSSLFDLLKYLASKKARVVITTDHGTVRTNRPYKIIGDKSTNTNLRYKQGKNLSFDKKHVYVVEKPEKVHLPRLNVSTKYVFTTEDYFFAYPNNYNYYVKYYKETFQHGGISLEEMIIPFVRLRAK